MKKKIEFNEVETSYIINHFENTNLKKLDIVKTFESRFNNLNTTMMVKKDLF